jgi:hypothetical protein
MPARLRDIKTLELLRQDHEHIGKALRIAPADTQPIAELAQRLGDLCRRHFEFEERAVLPVFARLQVLLSSEAGNAVLDAIRGETAELKRQQDVIDRGHQAIVTAGEALRDAASLEGNQQFVELAQILTNHERLEEDLRFAVYELSVLREPPPAAPR